MSIDNIDWEKAADGTAQKLVQDYFGNTHFMCESGNVWDWYKGRWANFATKYEVIATRPKPKYTPEQIEAVWDFSQWQLVKGVDYGFYEWLKDIGQ